MAIIAVLVSVVMLSAVVPVLNEKHSLYYIYTALSKPVDLQGIHEFTAMGLLDDREIDYYNSKDQMKIPKQKWMEEKMQTDYWDKGTQSRKSKEQWFKVNVNILMNRMHHNESDVHVLQWRHGCEIDEQGDHFEFSKGIDEYSYDGENFLSFDDSQSQWVAPVAAALPTKRKWDNVPILNQYTKGYLEKECVDWLNKFRDYGDEVLRKGNPPDVHVFARTINNGKAKLKLTCLATGFYPKDVMLYIRKYRTMLKDHEVESTGVRPNHDGTFQMRKSTVILENEKAEYDCFVFHKTFEEPLIIKWDGKCKDCPSISLPVLIGAIVGGLIMLVVITSVLFILKNKKENGKEKRDMEIKQNGCDSEKQDETNGMVIRVNGVLISREDNGPKKTMEEVNVLTIT